MDNFGDVDEYGDLLPREEALVRLYELQHRFDGAGVALPPRPLRRGALVAPCGHPLPADAAMDEPCAYCVHYELVTAP